MIKVLPKIIDILELFSGGGEFSFAEIVRRSGLTRSNASHLLDSLCELGLLVRAGRGVYRRGERLTRLGGRDDWAELKRIAGSCANRVLEYLDELAVVGMRHEFHRLTLVKRQPLKNLQVSHEREERYPTDWYGTGNGRILLAFAPDEVVMEIVRRRGLPERQIWPEALTLPKLRRELAGIRAQRFAVMTLEDEVKIISVPARDASGIELLGVSTAFPLYRCDKSDAFIIERLNFAAEHLTKELCSAGINAAELKIEKELIK